MKYRSFNEELLIATALLINVFNDIIIDRRRRGPARDYSKAISLKEIAQQKIEIPCIIGDRSHILRSLENEAGKYKLPLIILSNKSIKTDTVRMVDLHNDVFYQQDNQFYDLDPEDPLYKPQQLGKRRAQPINMEFDMTIITKYREDMDQILSNWVVFFRPDVYVKWWSPRREGETINSQILWNHNISHELPIEYNPTSVFTYKSTTAFTFKTWLFPGMYSVENKIDPDAENIIKKFKFFPNRGDWWDEEDLASGEKDSNLGDDTYYFGEIEENDNTSGEIGPSGDTIIDDEYDPDDLYKLNKIPIKDMGQMGFWGLETGQRFHNLGSDPEGIKAGHYMVNNVFSQNYPEISGDPVLSKIKYNSLVGDIFSNYDKYLINHWELYQNCLHLDKIKDQVGTAFIKNVYFKKGFSISAAFEEIPSGDFLYGKFIKSYINENNNIIKTDFEYSFTEPMQMTLNYNVDNKNLTISSSFYDVYHHIDAISIFNSSKGIYHKLFIENNKGQNQKIKMNFERVCDEEFNLIPEKSKTQTKNVILFNKLIEGRDIEFEFQTDKFKDNAIKLLNILSVYKNSDRLELNEIKPNEFELVFNDSKIGQILRSKGLLDLPFRTFSTIYETTLNGYNYQILINSLIYLVLKSSENNVDNVDIYDYGVISPLKFSYNHAPIFEITIPESKMLLGFAFDMEI